MRGLLVGATGILGSNLLVMSSKAEWIPTYWKNTLYHPNALPLNLADYNKVVEVVEAVRPEVIVHTAGITKPDACERNPEFSYQVNVEGSFRLIAAAKKYGIRLIFMSSDLVFDGQQDRPYTEADAVNPQVVYGKHKVMVEERCQRELNNYLVIRTGVMYGWTPNFLSSIAEWVLQRLSQGKRVDMFTDQYRNMAFVGDMVNFIDTMLSSSVTGIVHVASPNCVSKATFAYELAYVFDYDLALIGKTSSDNFQRRASVPKKIALDVSKMAKLLNTRFPNLHTSLTAMRHQLDVDYPQKFSQWYH